MSRPFDRDRDRGNAQGPRVNHRIRVPQVRVVSASGEMLGVLDTSEAQRLARESNLDLVEVNPKAFPPVCKIMDFGKFKYEEKKRQAEARKRQATVELKEIKLRPKTDDHDLEVKIKHILRFLAEGDKVKCTVRFRGREITHPEMAERQLRLIMERLGSGASVEAEPKMEGRTMTLLLAPPKSGGGRQQHGPAVSQARPPGGGPMRPGGGGPGPGGHGGPGGHSGPGGGHSGPGGQGGPSRTMPRSGVGPKEGGPTIERR